MLLMIISSWKCWYLPLCRTAKQAQLQINSTADTLWWHLGGKTEAGTLLFGLVQLSCRANWSCWGSVPLCCHLAGDWQEQTFRQSPNCSGREIAWELSSRDLPPPIYTFIILSTHGQDCLPLVFISSFHCVIDILCSGCAVLSYMSCVTWQLLWAKLSGTRR